MSTHIALYGRMSSKRFRQTASQPTFHTDRLVRKELSAHRHHDGKAVEVESVTAEGRKVAVLTLNSDDIRTMTDREILHVQKYPSAIR